MAGYSGTPLPKKLGIKAEHLVALVQPPPGFLQTLQPLPDAVEVRNNLRGKARFDVILFFTRRERELRERFTQLAERLQPDGGLWICWPKKASGVTTDVSDAEVRAIGLASGLVDNKVCAVDETWSGLRFVVRVADR